MFSIVYLRPDGWWEAGYGWESRAEAYSEGDKHKWGGTTWAVVNSNDVIKTEDNIWVLLPDVIIPEEDKRYSNEDSE